MKKEKEREWCIVKSRLKGVGRGERVLIFSLSNLTAASIPELKAITVRSVGC